MNLEKKFLVLLLTPLLLGGCQSSLPVDESVELDFEAQMESPEVGDEDKIWVLANDLNISSHQYFEEHGRFTPDLDELKPYLSMSPVYFDEFRSYVTLQVQDGDGKTCLQIDTINPDDSSEVSGSIMGCKDLNEGI